jgi:hypothetical protein
MYNYNYYKQVLCNYYLNIPTKKQEHRRVLNFICRVLNFLLRYVRTSDSTKAKERISTVKENIRENKKLRAKTNLFANYHLP